MSDKSIPYNKKTKEQYVKELSIKNPNIILIGDYLGANVKTKHKCLLHNIEWDTTPARVLFGKGCNKCKSEKIHKSKNLSNEGYINRLKDNNILITPLESYIDIKTPIEHRFPCGHQYKVSPTSVLQYASCDICNRATVGDRFRLPQEEVERKIAESNPNIKVLGKYSSMNTPLECKCLKCNNIWNPLPHNILNNEGCPNCWHSKGEERIKEFLDQNHIQYISQYKFQDLKGIGNKVLRYDFYIPSRNMLLEYHGKQHETPIEYFGGEKRFENQKEHDKRKIEYAKNHDIPLVIIWYYDEDNIEKILSKELNIEYVTTAVCA